MRTIQSVMLAFFVKLIEPIGRLVFWVMAKFAHQYRRLPSWAFFAVEHIAPSTAFELWVTKQTPRGREIFLAKRELTDRYWPNQWHFPGTIARITDDYSVIDKRLAAELGIDTLPAAPKLLAVEFADDGPRDRTIHVFRTLEVPPETAYATGEFHQIDHLPEPFIDFQKRQIEQLKSKLKNAP